MFLEKTKDGDYEISMETALGDLKYDVKKVDSNTYQLSMMGISITMTKH